MTATAAKTRCETRDLILTWDRVQEGDLALHDGHLEVVAAILDEKSDAAHVCLRFDGHEFERYLPRDSYTAVARYIETSSE